MLMPTPTAFEEIELGLAAVAHQCADAILQSPTQMVTAKFELLSHPTVSSMFQLFDEEARSIVVSHFVSIGLHVLCDHLPRIGPQELATFSFLAMLNLDRESCTPDSLTTFNSQVRVPAAMLEVIGTLPSPTDAEVLAIMMNRGIKYMITSIVASTAQNGEEVMQQQ